MTRLVPSNNAPTTDTLVEDTFAEAFSMKFSRVVVTALDDHWLQTAAHNFCGYATSVIGCDAEVAVEGPVLEHETPDGRPGISLLAFGFSTDALGKAVANRVGQTLMTCPTTAVFNGLDADKTIPVGKLIRFFGDGFQKSKVLGDRRFWRVPVMDGEFICEDQFGVGSGIAGGNLIVQAKSQLGCLQAVRSAVTAIQSLPGCITPFPGGVARSGSKVGSRYAKQVASTAEAFCPTLKGRVSSQLHPQATCAYEIVIDAVDETVLRQAMRLAVGTIQATLDTQDPLDVVRISAGNYGGKLGKSLIYLRSLVD